MATTNLFAFPEYAYISQGGSNTIPPMLTATNPQWMFAGPNLADIGVTADSFGNLILGGNERNSFGLQYQSVAHVYASNGLLYADTLLPGMPTYDNDPYPNAEYFYPQAAPPQLQTTGYIFGEPFRDYLPGHNQFNPANSTPPIITAVGNAVMVAAWAVQSVNGDTNEAGLPGAVL